jgi:hypothetical protein
LAGAFCIYCSQVAVSSKGSGRGETPAGGDIAVDGEGGVAGPTPVPPAQAQGSSGGACCGTPPPVYVDLGTFDLVTSDDHTVAQGPAIDTSAFREVSVLTVSWTRSTEYCTSSLSAWFRASSSGLWGSAGDMATRVSVQGPQMQIRATHSGSGTTGCSTTAKYAVIGIR